MPGGDTYAAQQQILAGGLRASGLDTAAELVEARALLYDARRRAVDALEAIGGRCHCGLIISLDPAQCDYCRVRMVLGPLAAALEDR